MGILANILGADNPVAKWTLQNQNLLSNWGAGIGAGRTFGEGLGMAAQMGPIGIAADQQVARDEAEKAERQAQINETTQYLQANMPDLAAQLDAGAPLDVIWSEAMKRTSPKGPDLPYEGTGMDAQNWNIVLTGDPNSPEYAAAYSQISQPKMQMQMTEQGLVPVWSTPQLPANIRPPTGMAGAAPMGGGAGSAGSGISTGSVIPGTQKAPTEQRARAQMMDSVISPEIETLLGDGTAQNPGTMDALNNGWDVAKDATGTAGRFAPFGVGTPSENYLKAKNAVRTLIASYLYVASGATANPGEVENQAAILTPQVGDPPNVVAGKKARIKVMADAVKALARGEAVDLNAVMAGGSQAGGSATSTGVTWSYEP